MLEQIGQQLKGLDKANFKQYFYNKQKLKIITLYVKRLESECAQCMSSIVGYQSRQSTSHNAIPKIMNQLTRLSQQIQQLVCGPYKIAKYFINHIKRTLSCYPYLQNYPQFEDSKPYHRNLKSITDIYDMHQSQLPNLFCIGCTPRLIKNFPVSTSQKSNNVTAYIITNEENFFQQQARAAICGLANQGGGFILIVKKHIKNLIKQGFHGITQDKIKDIRVNKLDKAIKYIKGKQNIELILDSVLLKSQMKQQTKSGIEVQTDPKTKPLASQQEFILRINVKVNQNRPQQPFIVEVALKKLKSPYKIYKLVKYQLSQLVQWKYQQIQQNYLQLMQLMLRKQQPNKVICSCRQGFIHRIYINISKKFIIQPTSTIKKQDEGNPNQNVSTGANNEVKSLLVKLCSVCQKMIIKQNLPEIQANLCVIILYIKNPSKGDNLNKIKVLAEIQKTLSKLKLEYKRCKLLPKLQQTLVEQKSKFTLSQNPNANIQSSNYNQIFYYTYQRNGKLGLNSLMQEIRQVMDKDKLGEFVLYYEVTQKIYVKSNINELQIKKLNDLIFNLFGVTFKYGVDNPQSTPNNSGGNKMYQNVCLWLQNKSQLSAAILIHVILYLGGKRPKCVE